MLRLILSDSFKVTFDVFINFFSGLQCAIKVNYTQRRRKRNEWTSDFDPFKLTGYWYLLSLRFLQFAFQFLLTWTTRGKVQKEIIWWILNKHSFGNIRGGLYPLRPIATHQNQVTRSRSFPVLFAQLVMFRFEPVDWSDHVLSCNREIFLLR